MDPSVIAAMAKWPNVPDCRGWLSLDRRGQWRLQGSPVRHAGLAEFRKGARLNYFLSPGCMLPSRHAAPPPHPP